MAAQAPAVPIRSKRVILVVDDATTLLRTAQSFLEPAYQVVPVADGFAALAAVQDVHPDLVLLDVMMPKLDGYNVCQLLRANPEFQHLPIVLMTGKDSPFDKVRGDLVGCDDYITKPFLKDNLLDTVGRLLRG